MRWQQGWEAELTLVVDAAFPRSRLLGIVAELQHSCPSTQIQLEEVVLSGAEDAIVARVADLVITSRVPPGRPSTPFVGRTDPTPGGEAA